MEHQCCKLRVRLAIKNLQIQRFLSTSLRWESAAEDQAGEQCPRHGRIKESVTGAGFLTPCTEGEGEGEMAAWPS